MGESAGRPPAARTASGEADPGPRPAYPMEKGFQGLCPSGPALRPRGLGHLAGNASAVSVLWSRRVSSVLALGPCVWSVSRGAPPCAVRVKGLI